MAPEILYGIGALVLLGLLVWAVVVPRLKSPKARAIREEAVREEYKHPEAYQDHEQDKFAAKAEQAEEETRKKQS